MTENVENPENADHLENKETLNVEMVKYEKM